MEALYTQLIMPDCESIVIALDLVGFCLTSPDQWRPRSKVSSLIWNECHKLLGNFSDEFDDAPRNFHVLDIQSFEKMLFEDDDVTIKHIICYYGALIEMTKKSAKHWNRSQNFINGYIIGFCIHTRIRSWIRVRGGWNKVMREYLDIDITITEFVAFLTVTTLALLPLFMD
jgi:hypothetical protein